MNIVRRKEVDFENRNKGEKKSEMILRISEDFLHFLEKWKPILIEILATLLTLMTVAAFFIETVSKKLGF